MSHLGLPYTANNGDIALGFTWTGLLDSMLCSAHNSTFPLALCLALRVIMCFGAHSVISRGLVRSSTTHSCFQNRRARLNHSFHCKFPYIVELFGCYSVKISYQSRLPHRRSQSPPTDPRRYVSMNLLAIGLYLTYRSAQALAKSLMSWSHVAPSFPRFSYS